LKLLETGERKETLVLTGRKLVNADDNNTISRKILDSIPAISVYTLPTSVCCLPASTP